MILQPLLEKSTVLVSVGEKVKQKEGVLQVETGRKQVNAEVWRGLAIHEYFDLDTVRKRPWRVTHIESGKAVLRGLQSREKCVQYVMMLERWRSVEKLKVDWYMTEKQLRGLHYFEEILGVLKGLQKLIDGVK